MTFVSTVEHLGSDDGVHLIDETGFVKTGFVKKGTEPVGVRPQYTSTTEKTPLPAEIGQRLL